METKEESLLSTRETNQKSWIYLLPTPINLDHVEIIILAMHDISVARDEEFDQYLY